MKRILSLMLVVAAVLLVSALPASATLVANGGFETGDWTGWTLAGNFADFTGVLSASDVVHSGSYGALFGPMLDPAYITQEIDTTSGQSYTVDFWLRSIGSGSGVAFTALWNNVDQIAMGSPTSSDWIHYSYTAVATGDISEISFSFRNDPTFWCFDDVTVNSASVVPVPGAIWLFGSGLAALVGIGRRRRK